MPSASALGAERQRAASTDPGGGAASARPGRAASDSFHRDRESGSLASECPRDSGTDEHHRVTHGQVKLPREHAPGSASPPSKPPLCATSPKNGSSTPLLRCPGPWCTAGHAAWQIPTPLARQPPHSAPPRLQTLLAAAPGPVAPARGSQGSLPWVTCAAVTDVWTPLPPARFGRRVSAEDRNRCCRAGRTQPRCPARGRPGP